MQVKLRLGGLGFTPLMMKNTFGVGQGPFIYLILASTSREDFRLDEYLEYPHAARGTTLPFLWDSNPGPMAQYGT
ncbi:hypothetical protein TNCV_3216201 [Trichonephila clavipes]|nr:hypothetical protein TNCV_3216201 [Trichonephila clavipes]